MEDVGMHFLIVVLYIREWRTKSRQSRGQKCSGLSENLCLRRSEVKIQMKFTKSSDGPSQASVWPSAFRPIPAASLRMSPEFSSFIGSFWLNIKSLDGLGSNKGGR